MKEAEIARLPADRAQGQLADTLRVPIDSTYLVDRDRTGRYISPAGVAFPASGGPQVPLRPYDEVLILKQPDFELPRTIEVRGEGRFPRTYTLRSKTDRLTDVIDPSVGISTHARSNPLSIFRRET